MKNKNIQNLLAKLKTQGIKNSKILQTIKKVPREQFISKNLQNQAYENIPLPIQCGQTISQPYIVAKMTELLLLQPQSNVLEIGTGSGYQTAILAHLAKHIFSIERIKTLQLQAKKKLQKLKLYNISTKYGDGTKGWPTNKLFDAIIITAASEKIPSKIMQQLKQGGILVAPIGKKQQILTRISKTKKQFIQETIEPVHFVPLIYDT
ncbi:MAG: L-isoaspartate protein carboxylmethyltransferase type II [Candidatus Westeberhardia cardiocondylae]|nr:L-isoaspartate protein carboxylmethyltransferase type II [Candidatus Westeberhardia cardiocondylae]